ncbi:MAG: imidazole glycerol phosphate synthase subunit HisH [Verrucomicrobia bacterium]|nr:imidazole glycerol phosphate synthase subunit HisH [Cytophagales bacterium]
MNIAIIRYNAGNTQSVIFALQRLGIEPLLTDNPEQILAADKVIFPGVGEASTTMNYLRARKLDKLIVSLRQPVLATCIGMQLLCRHSEENNTDCMGVFEVDIKKFKSEDLKIPQIGWNNLRAVKTPLMKDLPEEKYVYFVHSYYAPVCAYTIATADYEQPFSAALQKDNFYALQFHAEISSKTGSKILQNFLEM